jgi:hypothetical protein
LLYNFSSFSLHFDCNSFLLCCSHMVPMAYVYFVAHIGEAGYTKRKAIGKWWTYIGDGYWKGCRCVQQKGLDGTGSK